MPSKHKDVPQSHGDRPGWEGGHIKAEMQGHLNGAISRLSHGEQKRMRYAAQWYAWYIVLKCGYVLAGWPEDVPFTDLSNVGGGIKTLREIRRRWYLPDGDPEKLRFERASPQDRVNAMHDPESVHPTPQHLPELKARAAAADARAKALPVESEVYLSVNMQRVGRQSTSTVPDPRVQRQQRDDTGKRRPRASDMSTQVRTRRQLTGVKSMPYVLQETGEESDGDGDGDGDGERVSKRRRLQEPYALADRITDSDFKLTRAFGGELSDDLIEGA